MNCQLRAAWTAAPKVWVAAAYVRCRCRCQELAWRTRSRAGNYAIVLDVVAKEAVDAKARQQRIAHIRVIEDVEEICAKLHLQLLSQVGALG